MARVLIVEQGSRAAAASAAVEQAGFAVRVVSPSLPGDVFDALENVAVVAYLMADAEDPSVDDEWLETVLLKVVDTGVRGFVYERKGDQVNRHVEHARSTWHIPIEEVSLNEPEDFSALVAAVNRALGI